MADDFASFMKDAGAAQTHKLRRGERVRGKVVHVGGDSVFVDLGTGADGRVARSELLKPDGSLRVAIGDELEATVVHSDAGGGPLLAVVLGRDSGIDVSALELALETETAVEGRFSRVVKGGLEVDLAGVRAFCPMSQVGAVSAEEREALVGQDARFAVLEVRDEGRSVVVSRRRLLERERAERAQSVLAELKDGDVVEGEVSSLQSYGAFVDIGGAEGLVHISELSAQRVGSVEDVVSVGEKVRVKVLAVEQTQDGVRLRLSMKALEQPVATEEPKKDEILEGEVVRHLPHGLIVKTAKGEGLVPARELAMAHGGDHRRAFPVGTSMEVVRLDGRQGKLRFSANAVETVRAQNDFKEYRDSARGGVSAGQGALAAKLGKLNLGKLPEGPKQPIEPPKKAAPAPQAAAPSSPAAEKAEPLQAASADDTPPSGDDGGGSGGAKRRRIVSGR